MEHIILGKTIVMCLIFYMRILEVFTMKKLKMTVSKELTFEEGCNRYLEYCRQRNLREGMIRHYRQSYGYFYKYFDKDMPINVFHSINT